MAPAPRPTLDPLRVAPRYIQRTAVFIRRPDDRPTTPQIDQTVVDCPHAEEIAAAFDEIPRFLPWPFLLPILATLGGALALLTWLCGGCQ